MWKVQTKPIISRTRVCYGKRVPTESHTVTKNTVLEVESKLLESYSGVVQIFILPPFTGGFREGQRTCASVPTICSKNTVLGNFKYLFVPRVREVRALGLYIPDKSDIQKTYVLS